MIGQPAVDDAGAELRAQVDRQVRHAQLVRQLARAAHGLRRAAAEIAVVLRVRPQLERHADGLAARLADEQRRHGAVDAAAHRHERASGMRRQACPCARRRPQRAVQRVGRQLRRVALGGAQPAELPRDLPRPDPRGVEQRRAAQQAHRGAAGGERGAAAARVEAGVRDAAVRAARIERDRHADQIAARGAAGGAGERVVRAVTAPERGFEMGDQLLPLRGRCGGGAHPSECKAMTALLRRSPARSRRRPARRSARSPDRAC